MAVPLCKHCHWCRHMIPWSSCNRNRLLWFRNALTCPPSCWICSSSCWDGWFLVIVSARDCWFACLLPRCGLGTDDHYVPEAKGIHHEGLKKSLYVINELLLVIVVLIVRSADQSTLEFDLRKCYPFIVLNWVQLDFRSVRRTRKTNLPTNQKGYDDSETTLEKLMARRIQIFRVYFSVVIFDLLLFKRSENIAPTKIDPADLGSPHRIL